MGEELKRIETEVRESFRSENTVCLLIFGSYARGDARATSDLDLMVVTKKPQDFGSTEQELSRKFGVRANVYNLTREEFRENVVEGNPFFLHIFKHGKVLLDEEGFFERMRNLYRVLHSSSGLELISAKERISAKDL